MSGVPRIEKTHAQRLARFRRSLSPLSIKSDFFFVSTNPTDPRQSGSRVFQLAHNLVNFKPSALTPVIFPREFRIDRNGNLLATASAMKSHFRFIVTPTADTSGTTLLLHYDTKRYLFGNVAEGTQRAIIQEAGRLAKMQSIFISGRTEWSNTGGLMGTILSLADVNAAKLAETKTATSGSAEKRRILEIENARLRIWGASNLMHTLATARTFILRKNMPIDVHEIKQPPILSGKEDEPIFEDQNIKVWAIISAPASAATSNTHERGGKSPGKRTIDEMQGITPDHDNTQMDDLNANVTQSIVAEMFGSSWRLDCLTSTRLTDVDAQTPVFVRVDGKIEPYTGPRREQTEDLPDIEVFTRKPWPSSSIKSLPPTTPSHDAISYVIKSHPQRGTFRPEKAAALGVEKQQYKILTSGQSLITKTGQTVNPDMVLDAEKPGTATALIDLPTTDHVAPFLDAVNTRHKSIMTDASSITWILGRGVIQHPRLKDYITSRDDVQHIVTAPEICPNRFTYDSAAQSTSRLMGVDPRRYSALVSDITASDDWDSASSILSLDNVNLGDRSTVLHFGLESRVEVDTSRAPLDPHSRPTVTEKVQQAANLAEEAVNRDSAALNAWAAKIPGRDTEIITLGTGSAAPSKYRNVSATLVRVPGWGSILLDCGENTLGQLRRMFSPIEMQKVLNELRIIWISHLHADHHLGTASVIKAWHEATEREGQHYPIPDLEQEDLDARRLVSDKDNPRLVVMADAPMLNWLCEYSAVEDYGYSRIAPVHVAAYSEESRLSWWLPPTIDSPNARESSILTPADLGLANVQAVLVKHCRGARAVSFTLPTLPCDAGKNLKPFKVSYSGDCRPSRDFAEIGKDSTVCIHEATFEDELAGDALAKNHSTTSEALEVAMRMNAQAVVLTHFSQRYQKIPVLDISDDTSVTAKEYNWEDAVSVHDNDMKTLDAEQGMHVEEHSSTPPHDLAATSQLGPDTSETSRASGTQVRIRMSGNADMKVCVAFDYMRVKVGEIAQLEKYTTALQTLFDELQRVKDEGTAAVRKLVDEQERLKKEAKSSAQVRRAAQSAGGNGPGSKLSKSQKRAAKEQAEQKPAEDAQTAVNDIKEKI